MFGDDPTRLRRNFGIAPGGGWMLSPDLYGYVDVFSEFLEASGLTDTQVVASPVVGIPVPDPDLDDSVTWPMVNTEFLWHPFFWLPESVRSRALIAGDTGDRLESDEEYLIRIMAQCTLSGLFDVETGTWLDVLVYAGLDSEDEAVLDRVAEWQDGAADDVLDNIDLSQVFVDADAHTESQAVIDAVSGAPNSIRAQWALTADYVGRSVRDMQSADPRPSPEEFNTVLGTFLVLAYSGFGGGAIIGDFSTRETVQEMIFETQEPETDFQALAQKLLGICASAYMANKPTLDQMAREADEIEEAHRLAAE